MGKPVALEWSKNPAGSWSDLYAVDVLHPSLKDAEGVFVMWHGGDQPETVAVGQGRIKDCIEALKSDRGAQFYRKHGLYITWAKVERVVRDGVYRYLAETMRPRMTPMGMPETAPVEVNLPGQAPAADAHRLGNGAGALPIQGMSGGAAAVGKPVSRLQQSFDEMVVKHNASGTGGGFFGGGAKAKPEDEALVLNTVQLIMKEAMLLGASDVHLEPQDRHLRVRLRVDGILEEMMVIASTLNIRLVSHIRVMCGLDPEKAVGTAKPEDGRMAVTVLGKDADLRLSTFPTPYGEKCVLRIMSRSREVPRLEEIGLKPAVVELLQSLIRRPQGMVIVTGPTGSGKSTTLYTILQALNSPTRNIVTLEDPIEMKIAGITQGMVSPRAGFTFSSGLRAILRQDPNIIMVGEIRDTETAEIAMSAALTGHMIFTTLHTTSALGSITRLIDMGLEPFLISSALTAVCAQRLARRICQKCRESYEPSDEEMGELEGISRREGVKLPASPQLFRGKGCDACRQTGFSGRVLIFELIQISPSMRQSILRRPPLDELLRAAHLEGMQTLLTDGLAKASEGQTTIGELLRVVGVGD